VQMAFDAIEELQTAPVDEPLRHLLGDDGRLLLSYAVHWCSDAAVRLDPMDGGYRYEGPDVVYGGRIWAFAAPSVVTASEAVVRALPRFGMRGLTAEPYRRVNVVRSRSVCGATGDCEMNGGGGSSSNSGAATIYIPFPAPTTVAATAGMGTGAGPTAARAGGGDPHGDLKDTPLPPQMLLTLVDPRRPVLVAASAAAAHCHGRPHVPPLPASSPLVTDTALPCPVREVTATTAGAITVPLRETDGQSRSTNTRSSASSYSEEAELVGEDATTVPATPMPYFESSSSEVGATNSGTTGLLRGSFVIQGDGVTRALLRPVIPHALDVALHIAFDYQSITLGMSYASARVLVYYFYSSYKILFRPLAAPERHNIYRRLVTAFGVPQQGILEHLAARCAIRCLQQSAKLRLLATQRRPQDAVAVLVSGAAGHANARVS
jgi:hypothetical protein